MGSRVPALRTVQRSRVRVIRRSGSSGEARAEVLTFVLVGAASARVVEDGEVGGRDGVGSATAVAMVTAQATPRGRLGVNTAGAAAALRGDGWGCAVPVWNILWLTNKPGHSHNTTLAEDCDNAAAAG